jgi:hypothetical protein
VIPFFLHTKRLQNPLKKYKFGYRDVQKSSDDVEGNKILGIINWVRKRTKKKVKVRRGNPKEKGFYKLGNPFTLAPLPILSFTSPLPRKKKN